MRKLIIGVLVTAVTLTAGLFAQETGAPGHVLAMPNELKWGPPPPVFEQNAKFTVVSGDPSKAGLYVVRLQLPAGYKIAPHWHPTDEHVTVLSGTFGVGMGEKFDKAAAKHLPAGGYVLLPAEMRHYATAVTATTIQVHGMGPFQLTYVNPADDPSKRVKSK